MADSPVPLLHLTIAIESSLCVIPLTCICQFIVVPLSWLEKVNSPLFSTTDFLLMKRMIYIIRKIMHKCTHYQDFEFPTFFKWWLQSTCFLYLSEFLCPGPCRPLQLCVRRPGPSQTCLWACVRICSPSSHALCCLAQAGRHLHEGKRGWFLTWCLPCSRISNWC